MPTINFDNDKYIPTPLPEICAPRQNLLKQFSHSENIRMTAICAPAGYGKTVTALLWLRSVKRKSIWINLDQYDNSPSIFYKLLCTGILSVQPDNKCMIKSLNNPMFQAAPIKRTINLLKNFSQDGQSYALILDDLHTISNKQILKSLSYILTQLPDSFHVLLLSRKSLPEELEELITDKSCILSAKELAFSVSEIRSYYTALGRSITKTQSQSVYDVTGGWAIGINALSQSEKFDQIQGSGRLLENYINKNIWEKWDPQLQDFLMTTSIADELNAELCSILTNENDANIILDKLLSQNLFVMKTSKNSYRFNYLFLEFLRDRLKEHPNIDVQGLCMKIADFYFKQQDYFRALAYYIHIRNHDGINKCFFQLNYNQLDFCIEEWLDYFSALIFDQLPEEFVKSNITLVMEAMWVNYLNGNAEAALQYIDLIYSYLASEENLSRLTENDFLGFACTLRFLDFRKSICEFAEEFSLWLNRLPAEAYSNFHIYTTTLTENFPFLHRSIHDCLELIPYMDNQLQTMSNRFTAFFPSESEVLGRCIMAGLYYEQNKLDEAYKAIIPAQDKLTEDLRFELHFCVLMLLSQILNAMGKTKESESIRELFSNRMKEKHALYLNPNFLAIDTKYKLWNANQASAKKWLEQFFVTGEKQLQFYKLYQYFTTVRAYMVLSESDKASEYLEKLSKLSSDYQRPIDIAETGVLSATLKWSIGLRQEAAQTLEEVLLSMQPYHAVRIIAEEGAAVLPILKKIAVKITKDDYKGPLDRHYLNHVLTCTKEVSKIRKGISTYLVQKAVKLSKQQIYILTLLAQGYKNTQIVEITGLKLNTIRSHTKIIYQKLEVNNAADAVMEAKHRGMLKL